MTKQIAAFCLGETLLGIDILLVKEVYRHMVISPVPDTPGHIRGLMNLRGRVVTVIDLNVCLNRTADDSIEDSRLLILKTREEITDRSLENCTGDDIVGFLIDRMDDVISVKTDEIFPTPPNLVNIEEELIEGVIKLGDQLVLLLKVSAILDRVMNAVGESI